MIDNIPTRFIIFLGLISFPVSGLMVRKFAVSFFIYCLSIYHILFGGQERSLSTLVSPNAISINIGNISFIMNI